MEHTQTKHDDKPHGTNAFAKDNKFFILGEFNDEVKKEVLLPLTLKINELSGMRNAIIEIYINSNGGDGFLCFHLIHLLQLAQKRGITVRTIVMHAAFSSGSLLAVAGTKGERYITNTAEHCLHYGTAYGGALHTPLQADRVAAWTNRWFETIYNHYTKYAEVPNLKKRIADDAYFLPADKCIKYGLADKYYEELPL